MEIDHECVARRNSKFLGYIAGEVARPIVRRVDQGLPPNPTLRGYPPQSHTHQKLSKSNQITVL